MNNALLSKPGNDFDHLRPGLVPVPIPTFLDFEFICSINMPLAKKPSPMLGLEVQLFSFDCANNVPLA
ncbi:hypothetical protein D5086_029221 [Populus alba]|uniref:Uncharacterized protein n=1 Tax=Populus alba TaxID=43335 RepID=A0ACC4ATR0_POPAL